MLRLANHDYIAILNTLAFTGTNLLQEPGGRHWEAQTSQNLRICCVLENSLKIPIMFLRYCVVRYM